MKGPRPGSAAAAAAGSPSTPGGLTGPAGPDAPMSKLYCCSVVAKMLQVSYACLLSARLCSTKLFCCSRLHACK
jgi:hypothetical protein